MKIQSFILITVCCLFQVACSSLSNPRPSANQATDRPPQQTSAPKASEDQPVYVMPELEAAWVNPTGDDKEWRSGYLKATVVSPGHFSTREEAERSGRRYIVPGESGPTIPPPGSSDGLELNATTVAQRLAASTEPELPSDPTPPQTAPAPKSITTSSGGLPKVRFSTKTNEMLIFPGGSEGTTLSVQTPLGPAVLVYVADKIIVTYQGKDYTLDQPTSGPRRLSLQ